MFAKHVLGLIIVATPLISSRVAGAGWAWENNVSGGESPGALAGEGSLDSAKRAVLEGGQADIVALIRSASGTYPSKPPKLLELARAQFAADRPANGRRALERAASETPNDPRIYLMFGSLAMGEGRYSDARVNAEKALSLAGGAKLDADAALAVRREATAGLVAVAEAVEDWPSARTHLLAWLELDPGNAPARQRLGRALFRLGKTEEAFRELTRSAKDDPRLGPAAVPMALLFVQAGNDAKAEEWFVYASKVEPKDAVVRLAHARWRLDKGRAEEARSLVEEAAKLDPKSKEVEPLRGLVAFQLRDLAAAERSFEALYRDAPTDAGLGSMLTLALVDQDDPSKRSRGLQLAEANAKKFPKAVDVLASLARAHARSGHRDEAERLLRAAIAATGGQATPTIAYFLAQILAEKGQLDDARVLLTQAAASPIAFAYQAEARKLLASLADHGAAAPGR